MPSTYTTNNGIELIATGEQSGTWGATTNTNLELLDASLDGQVTITLSSAGSSGSPNTLPVTNGSSSNGRNRVVIYNDGGDLGATAYVQLTPNDAEKIIYIRNSLSGSRDIIVFQGTYSTSNDYVVPNGTTAVVFFNGAGTGAVAANVFNNAAFDALQLGTSDISVDKILDQDDMSGNDASALATQQSIKAYVDSQVATADTLSEVLANGNTTGGTNIVFGDSSGASDDRLVFGAGSDLQIYHNGTTSVIEDSGTGNLQLRTSTLAVVNAAGTEVIMQGVEDGAVSLYHNAGAKLATTSTGIDVTGTVTATGTSVFASLDISGDIDVDGTTNLDVVDIDGAVDMASTLAVGGVVTANAGVVVDNITIDGTEIDLSSGDLTLDAAGRIDLSADDNGEIRFFDGSLMYGQFKEDNSNLVLQSLVSDKDLILRGNDGGSEITALTLDMSEGGIATFNSGINIGNRGSGSDPTLQSAIDPNTGIFWGGSDILGFSTGGSERGRFDGSGNFLVNGTNATGKLVVDGDANAYTARFNSSTTTGQAFGARVRAGTNSSDFAVLVENTSASTMFAVRGDGNVGIGTSSPSTDALHVVASGLDDDDDTIVLGANFSSASTLGSIGTHHEDVNNGGLKFSSKTSGTLTEAMRLDASGNLLVGKTNNTLSNDGTIIRAGGEILVTNTSDFAGTFNRLSTDGAIVGFAKDGTTVGSIGTAGGDVYLSNGTKSLLLTGSTVLPRNGTGGISDGTVDLGNSSNRFKDLYLSGGAYLGGTGSANYLDDYEEGTWTPVVADASSGGNTASIASAIGFYTKVGNIVHVTIRAINITTTGLTSGNDVFIRGLPFTQNGTVNSMGAIQISEISFDGTPVCYASGGTTIAKIGESVSGSVVDFVTVGQLTSGNADIQAHVTYRVS